MLRENLKLTVTERFERLMELQRFAEDLRRAGREACDHRTVPAMRPAWYTLYMEPHMELTKKTTILFPPALHRHLSRLASARGTSIGHLVRSACEKQYGLVPTEERLAAVRALATLSLPVGDPRDMELESVPPAEDLP